MQQPYIEKESESYAGAMLYHNLLGTLEKKRQSEHEEVVKKRINYFQQHLKKYQQPLDSLDTKDSTRTGPFLKKLKEYEVKYNGLLNGLDESFMLFIVGTGKYGKSTLINALIGKQVAEVGVLPKTWKIDVFRKDLQKNQAIVKYRDRSEQKLTIDQATLLVHKEEQKRKDSEKIINTELKEAKKTITSSEAFKELKKKLEKEKMYVSNIAEVHWSVENTESLNNFNLVDTPGLTQNIMGDVRTSVQDFYHKADGVLWMLDATSIAASNAKKLVEDLENSLKEIGHKQQNIIAVLNRIDLVYNNQGVNGVNQVLQDAKKIYKGYFSEIIPFSAEMAYQGKIKNDEEAMTKSGLYNLYKKINTAFLEDKKRIQLEKKLVSCQAYNREVGLLVHEYYQPFKLNYEKYKEKTQELQKGLSNKEQDAKQKIDKSLKKYKNTISRNIDRNSTTLLNKPDLESQKEFTNETIFESTKFTDQLATLQQEINESFSLMEYSYKKSIYFTEYPNLEKISNLAIQDNLGLNINLNRNKSDEEAITYGSGIAVGLAASFFLGPLGLLVGGIVSWFAKRSIQDKLERQLLIELDNIIDDTTIKLHKHFEDLHLQTYERIFTSASSSFNSLYGVTTFNNEKSWLDKIKKTLNETEEFYSIISSSSPEFYTPVQELILKKPFKRGN